MAGKVVGQVFDSGAKGSDLLVLLSIAQHAREDGTGSWPTVNRIADETKLSIRTVQYALRRLEQEGAITIQESGGRHSNRYTVNVPNHASSLHGSTMQKQAPNHASDDTPNHAKSAPNHAIAIAPKPSIEPSIEPSLLRARAREEAEDNGDPGQGLLLGASPPPHGTPQDDDDSDDGDFLLPPIWEWPNLSLDELEYFVPDPRERMAVQMRATWGGPL